MEKKIKYTPQINVEKKKQTLRNEKQRSVTSQGSNSQYL